MKKEDIILKKGDKVYFTTHSGKDDFLIVDCCAGYTIKEFEEDDRSKITKIERLETIYEAKEILDKEEKEYLEAVLRPLKDKIKSICKTYVVWDKKQESIVIKQEFIGIKFENWITELPIIEVGKMYKGMEADKEYTLEELGLFEGE